MGQTGWEQIRQFLINTDVPCNPAIQILGSHLKEMKTDVHKKTYTISMVTLFIIEKKTWKQPRFPPIQECIKAPVIHMIKTIQNKQLQNWHELRIHITPWMNFKNIRLSERSFIQKTAYCITAFICISKRAKLTFGKKIIREVIAFGEWGWCSPGGASWKLSEVVLIYILIEVYIIGVTCLLVLRQSTLTYVHLFVYILCIKKMKLYLKTCMLKNLDQTRPITCN